MLFALSFFLELLVLFFLSKQLTIHISRFFFRITRSRKATIYLMALLFFPGTVIHELSHFLMAHLIFVQTGEIDLWPRAEEDSVKLGSVAIARSDPFRRFFIGTAPFLFGTALLLALLFLAIQQHWLDTIGLLLILLYALFEIGNTMFSSKKDMEGAVELFAVLAIFTIALYFLGVRLPALNPSAFFANQLVTEVFQKGSIFLLVPLGLDVIIILVIKFLS